jgi:hypothetical protein
MCACEGCEKPKSRKHPLCHAHAKRYQKNGVIGGPIRKRGKSSTRRFGPNGGECAIEGCRRRAESLGLCLGHYQGVRHGMIVEDGMIVSRQVTPDGLKYGDPWIKWSHRGCVNLRSRCLAADRDKWDKWAVVKVHSMRKRYVKAQAPKRRRMVACNATWDAKVKSMRGGIHNTAKKIHLDKWARWSSVKAILIYGRRTRNGQAT